MARHSWERTLWKRREARRRLEVGGWWTGWHSLFHLETECAEWQRPVTYIQKRLEQTIHGCMSEATHKYRKLWRRRARRIERLHLLRAHDEAEQLDPQPKRPGVMWDIW